MSELMHSAGEKTPFGPVDEGAKIINITNNYGEVQAVPAKDADKHDSEIAWTDAMVITYPKRDEGERDD